MVRRNLKGYVFKRMLPVVVWFGAIAGTVVLFQHRMQEYQLAGIARDNSRRVAAVETGRIKDVGVRLFQKVSRGQVLARMQDDHIEMQLQTIRAQIAKLGAEIENVRDKMAAEASQLESERKVEHRRFVLDVETARLKILELQAQVEPQLVQLGSLGAEVQIEKDLYEAGAVTTEYAVKKAQSEYDIVAKAIEENRKYITQAEDAFEQAKERLQQYQQSEADYRNASMELAVAPISREIDVQQALLQELQVRRMALDLRAPEDGVVRQILAGAGETVMAGDPVVVVSPDRSTDVIAYVKQNQYVEIVPNDTVELICRGSRPQIAKAQVYDVSPGYEILPERLWRDPRVPEWGRAILIEIPPQFEVSPGEPVGVRCL